MLNPLRRSVVAAIGVVAAVSLTAGQVHAAPEPAGSVRAEVQHNADNVKVAVSGGSLAVEDAGPDSYLVVRNQVGSTVAKTPLQFLGSKGEVYRIATAVTGRTATLTPPAAARDAAAVERIEVERTRPQRTPPAPSTDGPRTKKERDEQAAKRMSYEISAAMSLSSLVGLAIGLVVVLVIGGPLGCLLGLPAAIIGCLPGAIIGALTFASIGSIAGLVLGGGGGAIVAVQKYLDTINKPFKPGDGQSKPKAKPKKNGTR